MPRTPDFDAWPYHPDNRPDDLNDYETLAAQFAEEIRQSAAAQAFFAAYDPSSIEHFVRMYIHAKIQVVREADACIQDLEGTRGIEFPDATRDAFDALLQKKLFNLQLLWRNNQLDLQPHIRLSIDFAYWGDHIRNCPFLGEVTVEELQTLQEYLQQPFFDYKGFTEDEFHQHYASYLAWDEDGELGLELPDWYEFYDLRHGTGSLQHLADLRGAEERRYIQAAFRKEKEARSEGEAPPHEPPLPRLYAMTQHWVEFAAAADDACFEAIFRRQLQDEHDRKAAKEAGGVSGIDYVLACLAGIEVPPPVPRAGVSWQQAAVDVWNAYMSASVAGDLGLEWETYELYRTAGILPAAPEKPSGCKAESLDAGRQWMAELILNGREALGEPRTLDIF